MSAPRVLLDPTSGDGPVARPAAPRLPSLDGVTVALLDISKPRGGVFLDRVETLLQQRGATVARYRKRSYARMAPPDLRLEIATHCDAVIEALAD